MFDLLGWETKIDQEVLVGAAMAIRRLPGRNQEHTLDQGEVELEQHTTVKEEPSSLPSLCVPRKFPSANGQVTQPLQRNGLVDQRLEGVLVAGENPPRRSRNRLEGGGAVNL